MTTSHLVSPRRQRDRGRSLLADHPVQSTVVDGSPACLVAVRLPSYRSLPLSCIESISLAIDGDEVEQCNIDLILDRRSHRLQDLGDLAHLWWFILDVGHLRVRRALPPGADAVTITAELVTVEPYISNGRFRFASAAQRRLSVVDAGPASVFHV